MKQFRYKSVPKTPNNIKKGAPIEKKNRRRLVFYIVLVIIIPLLIYFVKTYSGNRLSGKVVGANTQIKLNEKCKVLKYNIKTGDAIHIGDTLFKYKPYIDDDATLPESFFVSSHNGIITKIHKPLGDLIYNNQIIISFSDIDYLYIEAAIDKDMYDKYPKRKLMTIYFADGFKSYGRISNQNIGLEVNKNKDDESKQIVHVEINPVNSKDLVLWKKYFNQNVEISK